MQWKHWKRTARPMLRLSAPGFRVRSTRAKAWRSRVRKVVDAIQSSGYAAREERLNCSAAWLGTIPGDRAANVRRVKIHTLNLAEFLPITSIWEGAEYSSCELMPPNSPPLVQGET